MPGLRASPEPRHPHPEKEDLTVATKKKAAAARTTDEPAAEEQQIAADDGSGPEPHEINSNLASDRMRALLDDHRKMGSRP